MKTQNKTISHKTSARVWVNTVLLLVATIIAGVISFESCKFVQEGVYKQFSPTSDYYDLCTHETAEDDGMVNRENSHICDENGPTTDPDALSIYFYNEITFSSKMIAMGLTATVATIGTLFTLTGLVSTIIYWNHNH